MTPTLTLLPAPDETANRRGLSRWREQTRGVAGVRDVPGKPAANPMQARGAPKHNPNKKSEEYSCMPLDSRRQRANIPCRDRGVRRGPMGTLTRESICRL